MLQTAAAAILHDIGYSPDIARSGFHALDGAVFLEPEELTKRLCRWLLTTPVLISKRASAV